MVPTVPPPGCLTPDFLALSYPYAPLAFARFNTQILRKLPLGFWLRPTKIHSLIRAPYHKVAAQRGAVNGRKRDHSFFRQSGKNLHLRKIQLANFHRYTL